MKKITLTFELIFWIDHEDIGRSSVMSPEQVVDNQECYLLVDELIATGATNGSVITWDLNKNTGNKMDHVFQEHKRTVHKVSFHPSEGRWLFSGSQDGCIKLFVSGRGKKIDILILFWELLFEQGSWWCHCLRCCFWNFPGGPFDIFQGSFLEFRGQSHPNSVYFLCGKQSNNYLNHYLGQPGIGLFMFTDIHKSFKLLSMNVQITIKSPSYFQHSLAQREAYCALSSLHNFHSISPVGAEM